MLRDLDGVDKGCARKQKARNGSTVCRNGESVEKVIRSAHYHVIFFKLVNLSARRRSRRFLA